MSPELCLKEAERKAWVSNFEDGLWEILFGLLLLGTALRTLTNNLWWYLLLVAAVLIYLAGKKLITIPRIGRVKFGPARIRTQKKTKAVVGISVLATLVLLAFAVSGRAPSSVVVTPLLVVGTVIVLGLTAYWLDLRRLYAYGLLLGVSIALTETVGDPIGPIVSCISGALPLLVGLVVLVRFLRDYPIPVEGFHEEEGFSGNH